VPEFTVEVRTEANGRLRKSEVYFLDGERKTLHMDRADLREVKELNALCGRAAAELKAPEEIVREKVKGAWTENLDKHRLLAEQAAAGSAESAAAVETVELLDSQPDSIRRPLSLINGRSYAVAWCQARRDVRNADGTAASSVEDSQVIVQDDGVAFGSLPNACPISTLGMPVSLPYRPVPGRGWSGAGVKRYLAGERPNPAEVVARLKAVVDTFIDFARSLAEQDVMCELVACYVLATYFLDAFHVIGYLWPNGEPGSGKTSFLQVVTELAYLGQLILAGSSYPTLRDMADYGACLAFDDAEAVMDTKRTDPDKRTLLLAGNRRGATIAVKELKGDTWETRYVQTFCPRLFSAIRLPDPVLGSRSIIVPLIRSGDSKRTKRSVMEPRDWPCDRRRLVDDLWAVGLANLPLLHEYDRRAAECATLAGRNLEPWRAVLAVALWLDEQHKVRGLGDRMEKLSTSYQGERAEYEDSDKTRVLYRALLDLTELEKHKEKELDLAPKTISDRMNLIAEEEDLKEPDKPFTSPRAVGWAMKRQRFKRGRDDKSKLWKVTRKAIEQSATAYGIDPSSRNKDNDKTVVGEVTEAETPF
jgi:hypothetical protein